MKKRIVVRTKNEEQWNIVTDHYDFEWVSTYRSITSHYTNDMCINVTNEKSLCHCPYSYYVKRDYNILSFSEWYFISGFVKRKLKKHKFYEV